MIKLGILGSGIITGFHFFALERIKGARVAAIASADEASGRAAADKCKARFYGDYRELLDREKGLNGIIVALPNYMHCEACAYAINAGHKNILCEKPLGINSAESGELVGLVEKTGVMLQTAYMKRFNPGFAKIKEALGHIGRIEFITSNIFLSSPEPDAKAASANGAKAPVSWHNDAGLSGGGILTHSGSHHLDLLRYLFGEIETVSCRCRYDAESGRDHYLSGTLGMGCGADVTMRIGHVDVPDLGPDWKVYKGGWNESVEVIASKGYIRAENPTWQGYAPMKVTSWFSGMPGPAETHYECSEQWTNELAAFVKSCGTGKLSEIASTAADGYRVDLAIEAMRESDRQNGAKLGVNYKY